MAKVALRGQKVHGKRKLRIQGRMQIFEKMSQMALNHDLRPELESRGKIMQIRLKIMDLQNNWFCGKSNTGNLDVWSQCHILCFHKS